MARWQGFYDELATTRYGALLAYATALTGQRATAEDLVQEALVRTFARHRTIHSSKHAENYVRRTIASLYIDKRRRAKLFERTARRLADNPVSDDHAERVGQEDAVAIALAQLSPQVRTCVVLKYYDDLTHAQISARLGLGVGTVKRYVSDGNARLRELLEVHIPEGRDGAPSHLERAEVIITTHSTRRR